MKRIIVFIITVFFLATLSVSAEDGGYDSYYDSLIGEKIDSLPEETRDSLENNGINPEDENWVNNITAGGVFSYIVNAVKQRVARPLRDGLAVIAIILISAAIGAFSEERKTSLPADIAAAFAVAGIIAADIWYSISASVNTVKASAGFMIGFIPIFAAITAASGATVTAASMNTLLMLAAQFVSSAAAFAVLPLMGGYLGLSISAGVSPVLGRSGIAETVKKCALWILSFTSTVFLGLLGIQTTVNSAADSVTLKTAKFILGTSVPVAGGVLSEAVSTVSASVSLLRSSIGIYGVVALCALLLPCILQLLLWRLSVCLCSTAADIFSLSKISSLLRAVDSMLVVLIAVILIVAVTFIISLTVVIAAGR